MKKNPYVFGEITSQGVVVHEVKDNLICECCLRIIWCGGYDVCFECRTNDCESVHPEMIAEGGED